MVFLVAVFTDFEFRVLCCAIVSMLSHALDCVVRSFTGLGQGFANVLQVFCLFGLFNLMLFEMFGSLGVWFISCVFAMLLSSQMFSLCL